MKKCFIFIMILVFMGVSQTGSADVVIKLGVVTKPGSAQNIVADHFKKQIEHRTDNKVQVRIFHSKAIGNETEILQQVQMGTIQMGIITGGPFDTFDPIVRVVNYPFLFKSNEQADAILDGPLGAEILKSLERSGFKAFCFSENGFRNLTNSKRPVKNPEDIKGLKIRVMSSIMHKTVWQTLGANPTPMPWPIYSELEQGVIDGQENPLWVIDVYKLYEVQKHMTLTRHVYSPHISVAALSWFNGLSSFYQKEISNAVSEAARFQRKSNRAKNADRLVFLKKMGMTIEENPNVDAFRSRVSRLKEMDLFKEPRVQTLLGKIIQACK